MDRRTVILGTGTGRCGTRSLSVLWSCHAQAAVTHEEGPTLPWTPTKNSIRHAGEWLRAIQSRDARVVGDVAHAWLPYIEHLDVSAVALWRDPAETAASLHGWLPDRYIHTDACPGCTQFPTYKGDTRRAWRRYVDEAHSMIEHLGIPVLHMDALNKPLGRRMLFRAAGLSPISTERVHHNASK